MTQASAPPEAQGQPYKLAQSVLVVIHRNDGQVLLLCRAAAAPDGGPFWQSVTGSKDHEQESWWDTAVREVYEETGIDALAPRHCLSDWALENCYTIYPAWQHRYAPGVWHNTERVLGLQVPDDTQVVLSAREHSAFVWLPVEQAAQRCFAPSNAEAVLWLPRFRAG